MEQHSDLNTMLQLMPQPAFRVEKGVISHINQAAAAYFIEVGQDFAPMIFCGAQEYAEFSSGKLYLTLSLAGQSLGACVSRMESGELVTLEPTEESPQLQTLALAAGKLKDRLSAVMCITQQMLPTVATDGSERELQAAQLNQRLYQMMRILNNMSDTASYVHAQPSRMETVEICNFLEEILEKAAVSAQDNGISLAYELPRERIFTLVNTEKLERAVYNLLSNAIKFAAPETCVRAKLVCKNKRLYFSVSNTHPDAGTQGDVFNHFLREPAMEDPRKGVGLGMALVCSTAALHGGAVLKDQTENGTRFTMTLQVKNSTDHQVRSPIRLPDYAGEYDHCLLELADVLPVHLYKPDQIK